MFSIMQKNQDMYATDNIYPVSNDAQFKIKITTITTLMTIT